MPEWLSPCGKKCIRGISSLKEKDSFFLPSPHPVALYAWARQNFYERKWIKKIHLRVPVVSVGNIVFGGSGKTPFVLWLLERYSPKYKIAVVCQSYGASLASPAQVKKTDAAAAAVFGDEATLIKQKYPSVDVWSGPTKSETAKLASESSRYDVLILDDGFTHHGLHRDLDLVLIDSSRKLAHYRFPPFGELRESTQGLRRADAIIFTKINTSSLKLIDSFKSDLSSWSGLFGEAQYTTSLRVPDVKVSHVLFSGVGNFKQVQEAARSLGISIADSIELPNHFGYSPLDQESLLKKIRKSSSRGLTTEKDYVKLTNQELVQLTDVLSVQVKLDDQATKWIDEKIRSLL